MLRHRTIRRDHDAAGSVHALLALWAFVDDHTFVTKAGDVGVVYRLHGHDSEGLDHTQRRHVVHRFEAALRLLGERSRVYQYFFKRHAPPITAATCTSPVVDQAVQARAAHLNARAGTLFEVDRYLVLMYEGLAQTTPLATRVDRAWRHPRAALRAWLSPGSVITLLEEDLSRAVGRHDARIYTDDRERLPAALSRHVSKSSAHQVRPATDRQHHRAYAAVHGHQARPHSTPSSPAARTEQQPTPGRRLARFTREHRPLPSGIATADQMEAEIHAQQVNALMSPAERILCEEKLAGLSTDEIALRHGISSVAVRTRWHRLKRKVSSLVAGAPYRAGQVRG